MWKHIWNYVRSPLFPQRLARTQHTSQTMFSNYIFYRTSDPTAAKFYTGQRWLSVTFIICKQQKSSAAAIRVFFQRPRFKRFPHFPTPKEKRDAHAPPTTTTTITTPSRPRKRKICTCTGVVGGEKKTIRSIVWAAGGQCAAPGHRTMPAEELAYE